MSLKLQRNFALFPQMIILHFHCVIITVCRKIENSNLTPNSLQPICSNVLVNEFLILLIDNKQNLKLLFQHNIYTSNS